MNLDDYTKFARTTAVYPDALSGEVSEIIYLALGLSGEAGEVANKAKKLFRDGDSQFRRDHIVAELGDVFWYLVRICDALDIDPETILGASALKLSDRKDRGVIQGHGDSR